MLGEGLLYQTSKHIILHVFLNFPWIFFFFYPKRFASRGGASAAVNLWMHFLIWCEIRIISVDMPRLCVNMPIFRIFPLFFFLFFLPTFVHSRWYEWVWYCMYYTYICVCVHLLCMRAQNFFYYHDMIIQGDLHVQTTPHNPHNSVMGPQRDRTGALTLGFCFLSEYYWFLLQIDHTSISTNPNDQLQINCINC